MKSSFAFILVIFLSIQHIYAQTDSIQQKSKLIPDHYKAQFAGDIGLISVATGYKFFKRQNGELDFFLGYLPESVGGDNLITIASKFLWVPFKPSLINNGIYSEYVYIGAIAYHAFGEELNSAGDKSNYPKGYYWWSIETRFGPILGTRLKFPLPKMKSINSISIYAELNTNDLYIYSWGTNRNTIPFYKIWNSSFGIVVNL